MAGESPEDYRLRTLAALRAHEQRIAADERAAQLRHETWLWGEAAQILVVEVIEAPRIIRQKPAYRQMEVRLRPIAAARGGFPAKPLRLRYRLDFNMCGYDDNHHFRAAAPGDRLVLFAHAGTLSYAGLLGAVGASSAAAEDTIALLREARP